MSPASQGALEVEHYIGSCLISSNVRAGVHGKPIVCRKQEQATIRGKTRGCYNGQSYPVGSDQLQQYGPGGWTGAPLISMTSSPRRCNQRSSPLLGQQQQQQLQQQTCSDQQQQVSSTGHLHKSPLSRLAIHTQGAPLILAGRFYNRGRIHNNNNNNNSNSIGTANTICSNYIQNSGNPSMTSTVNGATKCPVSRVTSQKSVETNSKKPPNPKTNPDCSNTTGKENAGSANIANIDSLSIASDESSGSNNSENSLPRIIKPRKRRKKDRKPPNNVVTGPVEVTKPDEQQQRQQSSGCGVGAAEQSSIVNLKPYASTCYESRVYEIAPPHLRNYRRPPLGHRENIYSSCRAPSMQEIADIRQRYDVRHRHVQVKVLDDNRNIVAPMRAVPPKAYRHHAGGNVNCNNNMSRRYIHEYGESAALEITRDDLGSCQCRYCDPSGLIWDVDRNGYSPFLTAPPSVEYCPDHFSQVPLFLTPPCLQENVHDRFFDERPRLHYDDKETGHTGPGGGVVLRRSWSDPTSYFSYEEIAAPTRDVGVIGDRGQSENGKRRTLWRGDSIGAPVDSSSNSVVSLNGAGATASPKGLEVSTEIITSPNGHRDLEIKFYSSPLSNVHTEREDDKSSSLAEEVDDDEDDDFSAIWSYHESKLQQDFRTLLKAEE